MERRIYLAALWLTPLMTGTTAVILLPRDPTMALLTGMCAGFSLGVTFAGWARSRGRML